MLLRSLLIAALLTFFVYTAIRGASAAANDLIGE